MHSRTFLEIFKLIKPGYIFPAIVVLLLLLATLLRLSGTSVGVYGYILDSNPGEGIVAGQPRTVRSDEWVVNTPFTLSQVENEYKTLNDNIGTGQDMSVVLDVPYLDWSVLFRPQNLAFFILPIEFAFAFKWWLLAALLLIAVYGAILQFYPRRYLMASLLSIAFFLSPFIQWWYQSITILPIAYALFAVVIAYKLTTTPPLTSKLLLSGILAYVLACFVLIMYPAFQITAALVAIGLFTALLYGGRQFGLLWKRQNLISYAAVLVATGVVVGAFLSQHLDSVKAIQDTTYPGARNVMSGGFDPWMILLWPFTYLLLDGGPATVFGNNQSEISGFLLFGLGALALLFTIKRSSLRLSRYELALLFTIVGAGLIVAIRLFLPYGSELFTAIGLNKVPLVRLLLAIGLLNLFALAIVAGRASSPKTTDTKWWHERSIQLAPLLLAAVWLWLWLVDRHFILTSVGAKEVLTIALTITVITVLLLHNDTKVRMAGLAGVVLVSLVTSAAVNPIYAGLPAMHNPLTDTVREIEKDDGRYWASDDNPTVAALMVSAGAEVVGGVNTYPQSIWRKSFPLNKDVTNRYAHIRLDFEDTNLKPTAMLIQSDSYRITLSGCSELVKMLRIRYVVRETNEPLACFTQVRAITSGQKVFYLHERT